MNHFISVCNDHFSSQKKKMRYSRANEQGAISMLFVCVIVVILAIGLVIIFPVGDSIADRRNANTAADSAALAGAGYCADKLEAAYERAKYAPNGKLFWNEFGKPVASYCRGMVWEASRYASKNNASLTSFSVLNRSRFQASVKLADNIADTDLKSNSKAIAEVVPSKGVCIKNNKLGVQLGSWCQTTPTDVMGATPAELGKVVPNPPKPPILAPEAVVDSRLVGT